MDEDMRATQAEKDAYKLMRRGTRACCECRRRKIRCIYDNDNDDTCQECNTHNRECIKQGIVRNSSSRPRSARSVKVQVTRLESAVEKLAQERFKIHEAGRTGNASVSPDTFENGEAVEKVPEQQCIKRSPIFSLFNNEVLHQTGVLEAYDNEFSSQIMFPSSNLSDRDKLLSTIANVPDVLQVLHFASDWWISWREQHFALRKTVGDCTLYDFVQTKLSSQNPALVALGLMTIAMALGQIRPGVDDLTFNLPVPANHIMNYILAAIDHVICDSERYQAQAESILLFMMRAKHHTEHNQLRKSWMRIRQAIQCARAIGFGAPSPLTDAAITEEEAEQQRFVAAIFEIDHLISMILGFPYAKDPHFTDARAFSVLLNPSITDESLKTRALRRIIAVTAAKISDRNAGIIDCNDFAENTQCTLDMAAGRMPKDWWNMLNQPMSGLAALRYESIMVQLWFWTVQSYLHMPCLISRSDVEPSPRYRQLCMTGVRNLLESFIYLRTEPAVSVYMCNCDDFQALIGSCILIVGVLQDVAQGAAVQQCSDIDSRIDADLSLIEEVKDIFRYRMHEQGGGISKQGLTVLEELTCFVYEGSEQTSDVQGNQNFLGMDININKHEKTIMLPYFGTIKVELTKRIPKRTLTRHQQDSRLAPSRSCDGSSSDNNSPMQPLDRGFAPLFIHDDTQAPSGTMNATFGVSLESHHEVENKACWPLQQTPIEMPADCPVDSDCSQPIPWGQWETYMFDQELDQDWNPGLQLHDVLFAT